MSKFDNVFEGVIKQMSENADVWIKSLNDLKTQDPNVVNNLIKFLANPQDKTLDPNIKKSLQNFNDRVVAAQKSNTSSSSSSQSTTSTSSTAAPTNSAGVTPKIQGV